MIYCLLITIKRPIMEKIGSLGIVPFSKGTYLYVGSAKNGLDKRIKRHLSKDKKRYWHIDYLLANPSVVLDKVFYTEKREECAFARQVSKNAYLTNGFGCSDCRCKSHLFRLTSKKLLDELTEFDIEKLAQ
ncbi:MAG: GIY-YIG nuclease family protein [Candidatus Woesearchaeota archaeon]